MSSPQMYDVLKKLRELDAKNPNVVTDAIDNTERMNGSSVEEGKKAKPDYLDFDKDGNKKEPMKKALKDKEKKKVDEAITITADSPEEAGMIARLMKLAGLQQVTPDMMPDGDGAPVMKAMPSIGGCGGGDYDNTPHEDVKGLESVTSQAGLDGVNGRKAPQDLRVKDPSDHADFTPRLKDLAGIHSDEVEEEWDNEPDEHYKSYDPDEYADKSDHATKNTRMVPARSGDNPMTAMEELEQQLMDAYQEFMSERELTQPEEDERERLVKGMKKAKGDFERRYGDRGEEVMYATATKMAKERR